MSYGKKLFRSATRAFSALNVYDETEEKLQSEVNSELRNSLTQLNQNIAYVESGNTASRTYTYGQFISWKGTLYTASTGIPMGDPFAVGTNLVAVVDGSGDPCGGLNALFDYARVKRGNDTGITITPASGVSIFTQEISRTGNIIHCWIAFTVSSFIGTYGTVFSFNKQAAATVAVPVFDTTYFLDPHFEYSVYISSTDTNICAGLNGLNVGSYIFCGSIMILD